MRKSPVTEPELLLGKEADRLVGDELLAAESNGRGGVAGHEPRGRELLSLSRRDRVDPPLVVLGADRGRGADLGGQVEAAGGGVIRGVERDVLAVERDLARGPMIGS